VILADVAFSTEGLVIVSGLLTALAGAVALLFRQLIASKDAELKAANSRADSYYEMAEEAIANLESAVNEKRALQGLPVSPVVPAVIAEHNSPTTLAQQRTADLQTMRARLVAATAALGLPAREAAAPEDLDRDGA